MDEGRTAAPAAYVEMHAAGASAREVFEKARRDGYKNLDCAFIVAGLFNLDIRDARRIGSLIDDL